MKIKIIHFIILVSAFLAEHAYGEPTDILVSTVPDWSAISKQLEEMLDVDQVTREKIVELTRKPSAISGKVAQEELANLKAKAKRDDAANLALLKAILSKFGWPPKSAVGTNAATGAWAVLQHADARYQVEVAPLFRDAVASGQADKSSLALLEDRILISQGRPQIYGTQVSASGDFVRVFPIADESNLDKLRAEVGLEPICNYLKTFYGS